MTLTLSLVFFAEYIHLPPPPDNQSEFAHVLRTAETHYAINNAINKFDGA